MDVIVAALSEARRPWTGWISGGGYTYYGSGRRQGYVEIVAVAVADRRAPMITEVTPVSERIMSISHIMDVIFLVPLYAPTEVSDFSVDEALYTQFQMVVDSCLKEDKLILLSDINTTAGYSRLWGLGPHGSALRYEDSYMLLHFAKNRRVRIGGS